MALPWPGPVPVWPALAMALVEVGVDGHVAEVRFLEPRKHLLDCRYLCIKSGLLPAHFAGSLRDGGEYYDSSVATSIFFKRCSSRVSSIPARSVNANKKYGKLLMTLQTNICNL
jgi:hypothetical protein